jgi:hypothetical protein
MTVTFVTKEKEVAKTSQKQASQIEKLVDSLYTDKGKYDLAKKTVKKYDADKNGLKNQIPEDASPTNEVTFTGTLADVTFTANAKKREVVDLRALHEQMGDLFYEVISVSLTKLDKYVSINEQETEGLVTKNPVGPRTFKLTSKE